MGGGPPAWGLGKGITTSRRRELTYCEMEWRASDWTSLQTTVGCCECGNEPSDCCNMPGVF